MKHFLSVILALALSITPAFAFLPGVGFPLQQVEEEGGGGGPVAATYITDDESAYSDDTATHTGVSIGSAAADRLVVVFIADASASNLGETSSQITSVTIGGVSATKIDDVALNEDGDGVYISAWQAAVPTGTTANIVIVVDDSSDPGAMDDNESYIQVYTVTGAETTPLFSTKTTDENISFVALGGGFNTPGIPTDGAAILLAGNSGDVESWTWGGITTTPTENFDTVTETGIAWTGATVHTAGTDTFFVNAGTAADLGIIGICWEPAS